MLAVTVCAAPPSRAAEGGFVPGPVGSAAIRAATLPPPGAYLFGFSFAGRPLDFRDSAGVHTPLTLDGSTAGVSLGLGHVFAGEVWGGRVGMSVAGSYGQVCLRATDLAPVGLNTPVAFPNLAATWVSPPLLGDGTEFSARAFYSMHGRNADTGYRAGDMVVVDWAVSERIGRVQLGPAGSFARQVGPDRQDGMRGPTTNVTSLGGVIAMDLPEAGMFLSLKALRDVSAEWRLRQHRIGLRIGVRL